MKKRIFLIIGLVLAIVFLAGCTETNAPITNESEGLWNQYIVYPLSWFIVQVAKWAGGNFGIAIIVVTIIIRLDHITSYDQTNKEFKSYASCSARVEKVKGKI